MTTTSKTAAFISRAIEFSGKSQREIAIESGFPKPNVLSMLKKGEMKIPLDRIPALAKACHIDQIYLLRLAMEEYHPAIWEVLVNTIGIPLTANEFEMLFAYRIASVDEEIPVTYEKFVAVVDVLVGTGDCTASEEHSNQH